MGFIKAALGSALGTLYDEWLEFIYCESMGSDVLMKKGMARASGHSGNVNRDENIITDGSRVAVNEGQCMLAVEDGRVIDFCAEPGGYIYRTGTEPSLYSGGDIKLRDTFAKMGKRWQSGGQAMHDQRVYFVNTKEILDNKIGIGDVPFRDGEFNLTLMLNGFGTYTYRIKDPIKFYTNLCANVPDCFARKALMPQLRAEMQSALLPVLGNLSGSGIRYDQLPGISGRIASELNAVLKEKWLEFRGIEINALALTSIKPDEASIAKIRQLQESTIYAGATQMLGARIGAAQASAMEDAAGNTSGAVTGFLGMNIAMGSGGVNANELLHAQRSSLSGGQTEAEAANREEWHCACGAVNTLRFCVECGKKKPASSIPWKCACGHVGKGKFCGACGAKKPHRLVCDKCGYEVENLIKPPRFCPQCGDPIDEHDVAD